MADLRDFTGKNRKFTGTIGERISKGTTAERDTSFEGGTLRFNTTTTLMEYYDGVQWKPIDAPPTISSVSPATFVSDGSTLHTITITGTNFGLGCTAKFIGNDGTQYTPGTVTRVSSSSVTMTTLTTMTVANEPYDVQITNASGLAATLEDALDAGSTPTFTLGAGTLGTLGNSNRAATALASQTFGPATDADGQQINYSITSGSISPGLRLGTPNDGNNGKISGTATAVGSNTTSTFTIQASDGVNTASRQYTITVNAPVVQSFTATGSTTFNVPVGVTQVDVLVVAGGGGGGNSTGHESGGGGGAGGYIFTPGHPVSPGSSVPVTVGAGGPGLPDDSYNPPNSYNSAPHKGQNSSFGGGTTITATGGGSGGGQYYSGQPGGSGGGSSGNYNVNSVGTGTGGQGNNGGIGNNNGIASCAGGGGGAGAVGANASNGVGGNGGIGVSNNISGSNVTYAGGGGGAAGNDGTGTVGIGGAGGGANGGTQAVTSSSGSNNRGGGAGGAVGAGANAGAGGSGIVIVRY